MPERISIPLTHETPSQQNSILDKFNLKGKTALVTGSSRGLGAAIAVGLAQAGASVAVHGSASAPKATQHKLEAIGAKSVALVGDVGDATVCARSSKKPSSISAAIDILVNNAGIIRRAPAARILRRRLARLSST